VRIGIRCSIDRWKRKKQTKTKTKKLLPSYVDRGRPWLRVNCGRNNASQEYSKFLASGNFLKAEDVVIGGDIFLGLAVMYVVHTSDASKQKRATSW
jgi:hypothetical protein